MSSPRRDEASRLLVSALQVGQAQDRVAATGRKASSQARTRQESSRLTAEELARSLGGNPKRGYSTHYVLCPVHEADGKRHRASLAIKTGRNGDVVFKCMAECCSQEQIIEKLAEMGLWNASQQAKTAAQFSQLDATIAAVWAIGLRAELNEQLEEANGQLLDALDANQEPSEEIGARYYRLTQILDQLNRATSDAQRVRLYQSAKLKNPTLTRHCLVRGSINCREFLGSFSAAWADDLAEVS